MLATIWEYIVGTLPANWLSTLWGAIPAVAIVSAGWKWWVNRRDRLRREAVDCYISDSGNEDVANDLRWRYFDLTLSSWTNTELRILKSRVAWPPTARAAERDDLLRKPNAKTFVKSGFFDLFKDNEQDAFDLELVVRVTRLMTLLPASLSRLTIVFVAETVDAQRRHLKFKIRSSEVPWGQPERLKHR